MDHISSKQIRIVRIAFIVYGFSFLCGYFYIYLTKHTWRGDKYYFPIISILVLLQLVYELIIWIKNKNKSLWLTTLISLAFILLETYTVVENTGVFKSPYILALLSIIFVSGSLGAYLPMGIAFVLIIRYLLTFTGAFTNNGGGAELGLIVSIIGVVDSLISVAYWRRRYDFSENEQLKRLNSRLKRRTQQTTILLNSIGDGVIVFDGKGLVDLINPPASAMVGWEVTEALGIDIHKILKYSNADPKTPDQSMKDLIEISLKEKKHITDTVKLESPKIHRNIIVSLGISPIVIPPDNELVGGIAILHDVTKEQEIEQHLSDFISTASHEMRTPLATIEGYLDLALTDKSNKLKEPVRGYIENAHNSTEHLGKLFQDLLSSSRAEDGNLTNDPKVIELREFFESEVKEDFKYSTNKYGLGFDFVLGSKEENEAKLSSNVRHIVRPKYYVYADPARIRELINNLFDNAIKFTQKGKVVFGISGNKDSVQFYIKDTGVGIPPEDIKHLFQKFYRVDNSPTRTIGGTGLGLFISRKIVELYGGRIWVHSDPGKGSTFYVSLPRLTDHQARELGSVNSPQVTKENSKISPANTTSLLRQAE